MVPRTCLKRCWPTRGWSDACRQYRYGFNDREKDFETAIDDFPIAIGIGARVLDTKLGRWLSLDPFGLFQPGYSLYSTSANCPLLCIDLGGNVVVLYDKDKKSCDIFNIWNSN